MQVQFITRTKPIRVPDMPKPEASDSTQQHPASAIFRKSTSAPAARDHRALSLSPQTELAIVNRDGSLHIPKAALDDFLEAPNERDFDVQHPGLDDMDKLLYRPKVLEYQATQFDKDWQGDKPRLNRVLETAVEKTTATVKIPIPGRPGAYFQCKIMILAAGGTCGFTANDDGYYVRSDDPDTLSPEEDKQCQAWWDLTISAKTQAIWRKTQKIYQQECRKPLQKL